MKSLDYAEKEIRELEAIKHYDKVKEERVLVAKKVSELEAELLTKAKSLEKATEEKKALEEVIVGKENEITALKDELDKRGQEALGLKSRVGELESKVKELEAIEVMVDGKNLKEAKIIFLEAKDEEVKGEAEKRYQEMRADWEKNWKWGEVSNEAERLVRDIVETRENPFRSFYSKEMVDLIKVIEGILQGEVMRRLDERFESKSQQIANEKLERMKEVEWPKWFSTKVGPIIREWEDIFRSKFLGLLQDTWSVTCDRCGTQQYMILSDRALRELGDTGNTTLRCANVNCRDLPLPWHIIRITFSGLMEAKLRAQID